jgi:hypothetical protein
MFIHVHMAICHEILCITVATHGYLTSDFKSSGSLNSYRGRQIKGEMDFFM